MDIRELRVGDIVTTNGKPMGTEEGNYYRVIEIDSKNNLENELIGSVTIESVNDKDFGYVGAWVDYLKPIPLTDELLKKIGAQEINIEGHHFISIGCENNGVLLHHSRYAYALTTEYYRIAVRKPIKYLHQLQHELYDAGIEFKIELQ